eukprot:symbB.v1.2.006424.t1/scaffold383.1/size215797/6
MAEATDLATQHLPTQNFVAMCQKSLTSAASWMAGCIALKVPRLPEAWYVAHSTVRDKEGYTLATSTLGAPGLLCASLNPSSKSWAACVSGAALRWGAGSAFVAGPLVSLVTKGRAPAKALQGSGCSLMAIHGL